MRDRDQRQKPPLDTIEIVDPLGEIRGRAKQLWSLDGSPQDKSWQDYWSQAEEQCLGGKRSDRQSTASTSKTDIRKEKMISAEIQSLINQSEDPLLSVFASAFGRFLLDHEAICLSHILWTCRIRLIDGTQYEELDTPAIAETLAALSEEYEPEFIERMEAQSPADIPIEQRTGYWINKLEQVSARDEPLTYSERNTINRIKDEITNENRVAELIFQPRPVELA